MRILHSSNLLQRINLVDFRLNKEYSNIHHHRSLSFVPRERLFWRQIERKGCDVWLPMEVPVVITDHRAGVANVVLPQYLELDLFRVIGMFSSLPAIYSYGTISSRLKTSSSRTRMSRLGWQSFKANEFVPRRAYWLLRRLMSSQCQCVQKQGGYLDIKSR